MKRMAVGLVRPEEEMKDLRMAAPGGTMHTIFDHEIAARAFRRAASK
jgi:hypothetical protein